MASITNWPSPRMTGLICADFESCGSLLNEGFLPLAKQRRMQPVLVTQIRNRHAHGKVSAQGGLLLWGKLSEGLFHGNPLRCLRVRLVHGSDISNSVWPRLDWQEVDRSSSLSATRSGYTLCRFQHFLGGTAGLSRLDLWFYLR
jgi:hypothetical protein